MSQVLVVTDSDAVSDLLVLTLGRMAFDVTVKNVGRDGVTHFREQGADIVVTDLDQPVRGGIDAIRELKKDFPDAPLLVLVGADQADVAEQEGWAATSTLIKPVAAEDLLRGVRSILDGNA